MAWNDTAPTTAELTPKGPTPTGGAWNATPPTTAEMGPQTSPHADPSAWETVKNVGKGALDYGLRGLDYAGGLTRTTAAGALSAFPNIGGVNPNGEVVTGDDVVNALKGKAPSSAEYMDRMGVPTGAKVNLPLIGDVSARGVGGFVGDVALDPLTYATLGGGAFAKGAAKELAAKEGTQLALESAAKPSVLQNIKQGATTAADTVLNGASHATESAGDNLYKSGFKTVDAKLAAKGQEPLSEVLFNNGRPSGTASTISDEVQKLIDAKMTERQAMYDAINKSGTKVDVLKAMEPSADAGRKILRVDPNAGDQVKGMESWLLNYGKEGQHVPVDLASDWKSRIYNATLPQNAYDPFGRALAAPAEMKQQFARGLKEGIEGAAESGIGPGAGAKMTALNSDVGTLINSQKKALPSEVLKSATKNAITPVDIMNGTMTAAVSHNPYTAIPAALLKKGVDAYNTTAGRTMLGNIMSGVGRSGAPDILLRREMIDANQSPWTSMQGGK